MVFNNDTSMEQIKDKKLSTDGNQTHGLPDISWAL